MADMNCRICLKPLYPHQMGEKNNYTLIACKSCGSVMADPWISQEELDSFYGEIQPQITHAPHPGAEIDGAEKQIKDIIKNPAGIRFLDVNCRQGYAVMAAKRLGMDAKGIDARDFFVSFAKSEYDPSLFEHASPAAYAKRGNVFDLVFSVESLCEQPNPEEFVTSLAGLVTSGGLLYMEEPDGNSFNLPKTFTRWNFVDPPVNFLYISKKGLISLLERHGFSVKKVFFNWAPVIRLIAVKK